MSVCHLNAIPAAVYIPDLRYLCAIPIEDVSLLDSLFKVAWDAAIRQFWSSFVFRRKFFQNLFKPCCPWDLEDIAFCGLNSLPSMYQLHMQFIHPPITPFHYAQVEAGVHFQHGRFFPLEYLIAALEKCGPCKFIADPGNTPMATIMDKVASLGVDYDTYHSNFLARVRHVQEKCSPWKAVDFEARVVEDEVQWFTMWHLHDRRGPKEIQADDGKLLGNCGWPCSEDGKQSLVCCQYAEQRGQVALFP